METLLHSYDLGSAVQSVQQADGRLIDLSVEVVLPFSVQSFSVLGLGRGPWLVGYFSALLTDNIHYSLVVSC